MRLAAVALILGACTDPVIEMHLVLPGSSTPAQMQDTSCVTAVEVHAVGKNYPTDNRDLTTACIDVNGKSYDDIANAIHNKFQLQLPQAGLGGIEMFGWSGASACNPMQGFTPDLVFYSNAEYVGAEQIDIPLQPNIACQRANVKARVVDMMALLAGTAPSSANCATAVVPDNAGDWVDAGTIVSRVFENGDSYYGGLAWANVVGGTSTFDAFTQTDPHAMSCFALRGASGSETAGSATCAIGGTPVCAASGELEVPIVANTIASAALALDPALTAKWKGIVIGGVWKNGATKTPVTGATVQVDPTEGEVVYVDPMGTTGLTRRTTQSTGASGMFLLYTNTIASVTVTAGTGTPRSVALAAPTDNNGAALIVLP